MSMPAPTKRFLYLEKGHLFEGLGFGSEGARGGEAVFNTGMSGYQEIFTDPSYYKQIVVMTYPLLGNTGVNSVDLESKSLYLSGVVAREYTYVPSNQRAETTLDSYLRGAGVPGIYEVDTREITEILRDEGAQRAVIFSEQALKKDTPEAAGKKLVADVESMEGLGLVDEVSCTSPYWYGERKSGAPSVVVYDYGCKTNTLRSMVERGFNVFVVPYNYPAQDVLKENPASVVLSNGPGDPACVEGAVEQIQTIIGRVPVLAICMGHQLLGRALGCGTYKLKFGHHGVNHPVKDLKTGRILITSQNHGFSVKEEDLKRNGMEVSFVSLNDHTVEGFSSEKQRLLSVQFHPEARPGPSDAGVLFDSFIKGFVR